MGIIDETDLLLALVRDRKAATARPVAAYMETRVETVAPTAPVTELLPLFRADRVAVVAGGGGTPFYGEPSSGGWSPPAWGHGPGSEAG